MLMSFSLAPVILRFILGCGAVVASTIIARSFDGRIGGIFAVSGRDGCRHNHGRVL